MKYIVLMLSFMFSMLLAKENTTYLKVDGMNVVIHALEK